MPKPEAHGRHYWCVRTDISQSGEVYLLADSVEVRDGALILIGSNENRVNMAFAPGHWNAVFAASIIDGSPLAVEHWADEAAGPPADHPGSDE